MNVTKLLQGVSTGIVLTLVLSIVRSKGVAV